MKRGFTLIELLVVIAILAVLATATILVLNPAELLKEGRSVQDIYKATGMSKGTVAKLRKVLEEQNGGPFLCGCGEPAIHQGNCSYRRERKGL